MEVAIHVPDDIAHHVQEKWGQDISHHVLESLGLACFRERILGEAQLRQL